jgi:hypothetical protein
LARARMLQILGIAALIIGVAIFAIKTSDSGAEPKAQSSLSGPTVIQSGPSADAGPMIACASTDPAFCGVALADQKVRQPLSSSQRTAAGPLLDSALLAISRAAGSDTGCNLTRNICYDVLLGVSDAGMLRDYLVAKGSPSFSFRPPSKTDPAPKGSALIGAANVSGSCIIVTVGVNVEGFVTGPINGSGHCLS